MLLRGSAPLRTKPPSSPAGPVELYVEHLKPRHLPYPRGYSSSLQVQMGSYSRPDRQGSGGSPYTGIAAPDQEVMLLFSEIDPRHP